MAEIEWLKMPGRTPETWNPIRGCSPISTKCDHCWARRIAQRNLQPKDNKIRTWNGTIQTFPKRLRDPLAWKKPRAVAVGLMSDIGHGNLKDNFRAAIHGCALLNPIHLFIFVTSRPANLGRFRREFSPRQCVKIFLQMIQFPETVIPFSNHFTGWETTPNIWDLVSIENQDAADKRIPELITMPSAMRGLSIEPMLGPICFNGILQRTPRIEWIVIGAESGHKARPFQILSAVDLMNECRVIPFFIKQLGKTPLTENGSITLQHPRGANPAEWPADLRVREWPEVRAQ